jgi:hypothetical protein
MLKEPILLIFFNRIDTVIQVINSIKKVKPSKIYLACDGPRVNIPEELEKVNTVKKEVLNSIDWPCQIFNQFQDNNLGCGKHVKASIDWFFKNEESGIILEDDCVPNVDFYHFVEELLNRYKNEERIGMICGVNHFSKYYQCEDSYLFSRYKSCWGWGTWRRAWKHMDFEMKWIESNEKDLIIKNMGYGLISTFHWRNVLKKIKYNIVDTWDWHWYFSMAKQNQLAIFPKKNLVSNIGFSKEATHTFTKPSKNFTTVEEIEFPLIHPTRVKVNDHFDRIFETKKLTKQVLKDLIPQKIKKRLKKMYV